MNTIAPAAKQARVTVMRKVALREFLQYIAEQLVEHPEKVVLEQVEKSNKIVFRLHVGQLDIGRVIGRKGRTAQAMRTMLTIIAAKEGKRAALEIAD